MRIINNLELNTDDIVEWCKKTITNKQCKIIRKGKNWYASIDNIIITNTPAIKHLNLSLYGMVFPARALRSGAKKNL